MTQDTDVSKKKVGLFQLQYPADANDVDIAALKQLVLKNNTNEVYLEGSIK